LIEDKSKSAYLRNCISQHTIRTRFYGPILTGAFHSTMMSSITNFLQRLGKYTPHIRFLLHHAIAADYLVTNCPGKAVEDLEVIRMASRAISMKEFNFPYTTKDGKLEKESFERMFPYIAGRIQRLRIIDSTEFEELAAKLVEYSTTKDAVLPLDLKRDFG